MTERFKRPRPSGFNWLKTRPALVAEQERERHQRRDAKKKVARALRARDLKERQLRNEASKVAREAKKRLKDAAEGM